MVWLTHFIVGMGSEDFTSIIPRRELGAHLRVVGILEIGCPCNSPKAVERRRNSEMHPELGPSVDHGVGPELNLTMGA